MRAEKTRVCGTRSSKLAARRQLSGQSGRKLDRPIRAARGEVSKPSLDDFRVLSPRTAVDSFSDAATVGISSRPALVSGQV